MTEGPDLSPQNERTRRLAERFGMTREDVEHLLSATHTEYSDPKAPLPPVPPATAPIEQAAERVPAPSTTPSQVSSKNKPLSAGTIIGIFTVLLIGLGIAVSFQEGCFKQRHERVAQKPVDTVQNMLNKAAEQASTPQTPSNVPPGEVPPEALVVPREEPKGTSGPPSNSGTTTESDAQKAARHLQKPLLSTSSEFEAQEKLAELRADGNTHARIRALRKSGSIKYQVVGK